MWEDFVKKNWCCEQRKLWTLENEFNYLCKKLKNWILKAVYGKHLLNFSDSLKFLGLTNFINNWVESAYVCCKKKSALGSKEI